MDSEKHFWLHRISHHAEIAHPLFDMGYLSYGWLDFAVIPNFISNVRSDSGWEYLEKEMIRVWDCLPPNRHQLWRYIYQFKKGDWVLVPSWYTFSICEILDDEPLTMSDIKDLDIKDWNGNAVQKNGEGFFVNDNNEMIDLGFVRRIKIIARDIPRADYADAALLSRMKVRQTNVNIDDLSQMVLDALTRYKENMPINFRRELDAIIPRICESINTKLDDSKFERLVKWFFMRQGATSVEIPPKNPSGKRGDEDVDVIATFDLLNTIYYVQVKHHIGETDSWATEQISLVKKLQDEKTDDSYSRIYWVLSSAETFSDECQRKALETGVRLIDGKAFASMLIDSGFLGVNESL